MSNQTFCVHLKREVSNLSEAISAISNLEWNVIKTPRCRSYLEGVVHLSSDGSREDWANYKEWYSFNFDLFSGTGDKLAGYGVELSVAPEVKTTLNGGDIPLQEVAPLLDAILQAAGIRRLHAILPEKPLLDNLLVIRKEPRCLGWGLSFTGSRDFGKCLSLMNVEKEELGRVLKVDERLILSKQMTSKHLKDLQTVTSKHPSCIPDLLRVWEDNTKKRCYDPDKADEEWHIMIYLFAKYGPDETFRICSCRPDLPMREVKQAEKGALKIMEQVPGLCFSDILYGGGGSTLERILNDDYPYYSTDESHTLVHEGFLYRPYRDKAEAVRDIILCRGDFYQLVFCVRKTDAPEEPYGQLCLQVDRWCGHTWQIATPGYRAEALEGEICALLDKCFRFVLEDIYKD